MKAPKLHLFEKIKKNASFEKSTIYKLHKAFLTVHLLLASSEINENS